jgi:hypothetical protein
MRSVLIVEADERLLGERAEQLLMDGYQVDAVSAFEAARIKLAERPDALVLCNAGSAGDDRAPAPSPRGRDRARRSRAAGARRGRGR